MPYIEGTSQPNIGKNSYRIVAEEKFTSDTKFFWRTKSSKNQNDPFIEFAQKVTLEFLEQHVGMNYTIEVYYVDKKGKSSILTKAIKVVSDTGSHTTDTKQVIPDSGNKSAVINTPDKRLQEDGEEKKIKIHLYFDGTFGNKDNINMMESAINDTFNGSLTKPRIYDEKYKNAKGEIDHDKYNEDLEKYKAALKNKKDVIKEKTRGYDPTEDDISYTQVFTNIGIMHDLELIEEYDDEKIIKIYVEGVGTKTGDDDDMLALAIGCDLSGRGIQSKIKRAFEEIKKQTEKKGIKNDIITSVEVCAIGFSRGAATTRNFVAERDKLLSTLKEVNNNITDSMISYKFVGIFDTVCSVSSAVGLIIPLFGSYSIQDNQYNDRVTTLQRHNITEFKLAMKDKVQEVVHLVAANEYRLFFPLTDIQTSIDAGCGYELILPGSHCDIGGGDKDSVLEAYEEVVKTGDENNISKFLIENDWFDVTNGTPITEPNPNKDTYIYSSSDSILGRGIFKSPGYDVVGTRYELKRNVAVGYNKIPLSIMLHYAMSLAGIEQNNSLCDDSTKVYPELEELKMTFINYIKNNKHEHKRDMSLMEEFNKKQYASLRKHFIHISALEKGSFTETIKNQMRTNETDCILPSIYATFYNKLTGIPTRAIYNDGDSGVNLIEYYGFKVGEVLKNAVDFVVKKGEEMIGDVVKKGEEMIGDAVKKGEEMIGDIVKKDEKIFKQDPKILGKTTGKTLLKKNIKNIGKKY